MSATTVSDDVVNSNDSPNDEAKDLEELNTYIKELKSKIDSRRQLRIENLKCERPNSSYFVKLDSSLKKNTAFVKKLKLFTSSQLDTLMKDMSGLNLSKYVSEICTSLTEAKLKMTDVPAVIILCSKLNQIYNDFSAQFFDAWHRILTIKSGEKITNASKLRVDLRLFAELISAGIIGPKPGLSLLNNVLTTIVTHDKDDHSNFSVILSFTRHCGEEFAGLIPKKIKTLSAKYTNVGDLPKSEFLNVEKQGIFRNLLKDYFKNCCRHLLAEQTELMDMTKQVRRTIESKGEISNDKKEKCELMQANFDKLLTSMQTLSDYVDEPLPELNTEPEICNPGTVIESILDDPALGDLDPWGDDETKSFYTDLPDLRQFLPNYSSPRQDAQANEEHVVMTEEALDADIDAEMDIDDPPSTASDPSIEKESEPTDDTNNANNLNNNTGNTLPDKIGNALMEAGRMNSSHGYNSKYQFDIFLQNLNNCVNKELIDSAAIEFLLNFNTKNNRKKLVKALFGVQRTRLDLLPFLSRFVAIINLCNTDVALELSDMLRKEFKWHIRKKNQLNIESKIKIVRFIGEMVKFGLYKKFDALSCLKILLRDFQHHQIEMACAFIEVAGVYLYNSRDSRLLMNVFLDLILRLKTATALDSRHAAQVESVYYLVKPPESAKQEIIERPIIHEYIRYVIFEELSKANVDRCIRMMRRINWHDPNVSSYAIKCMSKAYLLRFPLIRCLADLVSGMSSFQSKAVTQVIDNVFEDIRAGLEIHSPKLAQRRIAMAKYLGELYNYKLVESTNVLNTLYSIISYGVSTEEGVISELDPPDSLFRLKLACVLLDTCGQYFTSSITRKKLDYFLVFFQHYYWFKKSNPIFSKVENTHDLFPILVDHMYRDCLINVRPKIKFLKSFEQCKEAVEKLKLELYPRLNEEVAATAETRNSVGSDAALEPIREDSELEEMPLVTDDSSSEVERRTRFNCDDENYNEHENENEACTTDWTENELMNDDIAETQKIYEKTKEDFEFEQMYEKMAADSYQERIKEATKYNKQDIPVPMMARNNKKSYEQITQHLHQQQALQSNVNAIAAISATKTAAAHMDAKDNVSSGIAANAAAASGGNSDVPFVLMVRGGKGGKQQFKTFVAPSDSQLAINLKLQEEKIREEKEKVKRLTLNITERIEEEDYQESLLQPHRNFATSSTYQRYNKSKFKHQKGAPDADLIFH